MMGFDYGWWGWWWWRLDSPGYGSLQKRFGSPWGSRQRYRHLIRQQSVLKTEDTSDVWLWTTDALNFIAVSFLLRQRKRWIRLIPLRGYMLKSLAAFVLVTATNSFSSIFPVHYRMTKIKIQGELVSAERCSSVSLLSSSCTPILQVKWKLFYSFKSHLYSS